MQDGPCEWCRAEFKEKAVAKCVQSGCQNEAAECSCGFCPACAARLDAEAKARPVPTSPEDRHFRETYPAQVAKHRELFDGKITLADVRAWAEAQGRGGKRHAHEVLKTHAPLKEDKA